VLRLTQERNTDHEALVYRDNGALLSLVVQRVAHVDAGPKSTAEEVVHLRKVLAAEIGVDDRSVGLKWRLRVMAGAL
jgi:hypothetical protein